MKKLCTFLSALFLTTAAFAQIPNASFETWSITGGGTGYDSCASWSTPNFYVHNIFPGTYTCEKGTGTAPDGAAYIKLTSKTVATVVVPGMAVAGSLNVNIASASYGVSGGFPYATRAATLTGKWQHMGGSASDHGRIMVYLSKWNTTLLRRDTVAWADSTLTGMAMAWADFTIPLKYKSSTLSPDTGIIVLSSSSTATPVATSYLWVDKLAFAGTIPTGVVSVNMMDETTTVFPNPATVSTNVYYHSTKSKELSITLTDITGKVLRTMDVRAIAGENSIPIDLKNVAQGMYFIQIRDENSVIQNKLIVQ